MKKLIATLLLALSSLFMPVSVQAAGDTPISNLRLTTSANGGYNWFTNLLGVQAYTGRFYTAYLDNIRAGSYMTITTNYTTNVVYEIIGWTNLGIQQNVGISGSASVTYHNNAWLMSGDDYNLFVQVCDGNGNFYLTNNLLAGRWLAGAEVLNDKVYFIGGNAAITRSNVYEWAGSWSEVKSLPLTLEGMATVVYSNKIWVMGGTTRAPGVVITNVVYSFDGTNWFPETYLPASKTGGRGEVLNNKIYVFGGNTTNTYEYSNGTWTEVAGMPTIYNGSASCTINARIYVLNGIDSSPTNYTVHVFDGSTWTTNAMFPEYRPGASCVVLNDRIYAFCGTVYPGISGSSNTYASLGTYTTNVIVTIVTNFNQIVSFQNFNGIDVLKVYSDKLEPSVSNVYDLGSAAMPFRNGYFGTGAVYLGSTPLTESKVKAYDVHLTNRIFTGIPDTLDGPLTWVTAAALPQPRRQLAAATLNGKIYAIGGDGTNWWIGGNTNVYEFNGTTWSEVAGLPIGSFGLAAATLGTKLYAIGGQVGASATTNVYSYDGINWTEVIGLPQPRDSLAAATLNGKIYAIGGDDAGGKTNVYSYDGTNWTEVAGLPQPRKYLAAATLNGKIYAIGGDFAGFAKTNVYSYDGTNWTEVAGLPQPRRYLAATTMGNKIYAIGGSTTNVYEFNGTTWTETSGLPLDYFGLAAATLSNNVYTIGGQSVTTIRADVWKWTATGIENWITMWRDVNSNTVLEAYPSKLIPRTNVYDLGSAENPFRDLHLINPVAQADTSAYAVAAGTATYADNAGFALVAVDAGFAYNAENAGTSYYASVAGDASNLIGPTSTVSGVLLVSSNILPSVSNAYDLGSLELPFRDLYLGSNSIYMGGLKVFSLSNGQLVVDTVMILPETTNGQGAVAFDDMTNWVSNYVTSGIPSSGTSSYAIVAGTSYYATAAGTADWSSWSANSTNANYALQAGTSYYANVAGRADYASWAANSTNAEYALQAGTSYYASAAASADWASVAANSTNAEYALQSGTSTYAIASGTSTYATVAGRADWASVAANSTNAEYALQSGTSTYANVSAYASVAANSTNAEYALQSGTSTYATVAGTVNYASVAANATNAEYALQAGTSVYARTSGTSTYANAVGSFNGSHLSVSGGLDTAYAPLIKAYGTNDTGNLTTEGLTHGHWIAVDGVSNSQKGFVWAEAGVPYWNEEIFNNEEGQFLYLRSRKAANNVMTYSDSGRVGINKQIDIMDYHSRFIGTGLNDMDVAGVYNGKVLRIYKVIITATGTTDTWQYAYSTDNSSYTTNATSYSCSTTETNVERGITVKWAAITGHTAGDYWQFAGYPQLPLGTLTVNPDKYDEILTATNIYGGAYQDLTYNLSTLDDGNPNTILQLGTNSALYLGSAMKRNAMYVDLATPAQGCTLSIEYWNGGTWVAINTATNNLFEGTANLSQNGLITWNKSTFPSWTTTNLTVDSYVNQYYWIRVRSTTTITVAPTAYGVMPNGQYRLAVFGGKLDYKPALYVNGDGKTHVTHPLMLEGFSTNQNEAATVKYVADAIAASAQSTYYLHSTTNSTVPSGRNLQLFGPDTSVDTLTTNNISGSRKFGFAWYASNAYDSAATVQGGTWNTFTYAAVDNTGGGTVSRWIIELVKVLANGSTSVIASATSDRITVTTTALPQLLQTPIEATNFNVASGERIGLNYWATNTGTARNLSIVFEGNYPSRMVAPYSAASGIISANASYAYQAGTSVYATAAGTANWSSWSANSTNAQYALQAGTSVYARTAGTSTYAIAAGTSVYATTAGDVTGTTTGKVATWYNYPVKGHITVDASNAYDLGTALMPFRHGYFGTNSVYFGDEVLNSDKLKAYDINLTNKTIIAAPDVVTVTTSIVVTSSSFVPDVTGTYAPISDYAGYPRWKLTILGTNWYVRKHESNSDYLLTTTDSGGYEGGGWAGYIPNSPLGLFTPIDKSGVGTNTYSVTTNVTTAPTQTWKDSNGDVIFELTKTEIKPGSSNVYNIGTTANPFNEAYFGGSAKMGFGIRNGTNRLWFSNPPYTTTNWPIFESD